MSRLRIKSIFEDEPTNVELTDRLTIGRNHGDVENDVNTNDHIPLPDSARMFSKRHAEVFEADGRHYVKDLGSTNGTSLNGVRLQPHEAYELENGYVIGMPIKDGQAMKLTYEQSVE